MRICIVEDNLVALEAIADLLRNAFEGAEIISATNEQQALKLFHRAAKSKQETLDAIVIDLDIPASSHGAADGIRYSVTHKAAELFSESVIVVYSAYAKDVQTELGKLTKSGRVAVVDKAESPAKLVDLIRTRYAKQIEAELMARMEAIFGRRGKRRKRGPYLESAGSSRRRCLTMEYKALRADVRRYYKYLSPKARKSFRQHLGLSK